ncbi:sugar porter family MFS transporter [Microbacterium hydrocarbonoxydans]|uniref:sugar porter family MFS transporter n=1 Tax=Microbacterium hydrocarbonoxydans TaxID=273678 RepID=UPI0007BBBE26|nr:sugar porter family MFS transporter [Microbacterium hydrocarbonoxydans]GAT74885.1 galactose-proton symporter [Microbacterium sp. HM58-2]
MHALTETPRLTRLALLVGVAAATVGVIYGYDSSNIGGALLYLREDFSLDPAAEGWVTSTVVFGEIAGALFGGALANRVGRKPTMVLVAATFTLFSLLSGIAPTLIILVIARILLGVTIGISVVVVPVFVAESAPARSRGAFLVLYQVATVTGIILGYLIAMALAPTQSWRWMLGLAAIPGLIITLLLLRLPDTARWYISKGRPAEARKTLTLIEGDGVDIDREIEVITAGFASAHTSSWRDLLRKPYLRATIFVVGLGFFVQITGINAIVYYSPAIFESMGYTEPVTLLGLSALVQVAGLVAVFISLMVIDRMGRRPVLLIGIAVMIVANVLLIAVFAIGGGSFDGALTVLGFIGLVLFTAGFTFGFGSLVWVYAGEAMPSHLRALGATVMLTSDLVANVIVGLAFRPILEASGTLAFTILGAMAVAAFLFVARLAPETKGRPLEDIGQFWENGGSWTPRR